MGGKGGVRGGRLVGSGRRRRSKKMMGCREWEEKEE